MPEDGGLDELHTLLAPFSSWRRSHAVALAAWVVQHLPISDIDARPEIALAWLHQQFRNVDPEERFSDIPQSDGKSFGFLSSYAAGMLARLSARLDLMPSDIEWVPQWADRIYNEGILVHGSRPSFDRAARTLASAVVDGTLPAIGLMELAGWLINRSWRDLSSVQPFIDALASALPLLRTFPGKISKKIEVLAAIRAEYECACSASLIPPVIGWSRVESYVLDGLFSWPLLADPTRPGETGLGFALPIYVGVDFTANHNKPRILGVENGRLHFTSDWHASVESAALAARDLWRKECGHFGRDWIEWATEKSAMVVNVCPAEAILDEFHDSEEGVARFELAVEGRSADLCFSLAAFANLRGLHYPLSAAATGMIRDPERRQIDVQADILDRAMIGLSRLDRELAFPRCVTEKLRWVDAAGMVDLVILANGPSQSVTLPTTAQWVRDELTRLETYLSTDRQKAAHRPAMNRVSKLSNAADSAFGGEWRRWHFIRCPDLHRLVFDDVSASVPNQDDAIMRYLGASQSTVLPLPASITAPTLVAALLRINEESARAKVRADNELPPMLAISFVRLVPDEGGDRLCGVLCDLAGAPTSMIEKVCSAPTEDDRARSLAEVLNHAEFDLVAPGWRPPDLLVLCVPERILKFARTGAHGENELGHDWRLVMAPLMNAKLSASLKRIADKRWGKTLGMARILLVSDEQGPDPSISSQKLETAEADHAEGELDNVRAIDALSTFRAEFSQQEASVLLSELGVTGHLTRVVLKKLERIGMVYEVPGAWALTRRARAIASKERIDLERQFQRNWAATVARAPYSSPKRWPGLADFEARRFHRVHEAQFHLHEAITIASELARKGAYVEERLPPYTLLFAQQARIRCYFDVQGWDLVHSRIADHHLPGGYRARIADALVSRSRANGQKIAIEHAVMVLRTIMRQMREIEQAPKYKRKTLWAARVDPDWKELAEKMRRLSEEHLEIEGMGDSKANFPQVSIALPRLDELSEEEAAEFASVFATMLVSGTSLRSENRQSLDAWVEQAVIRFPSIDKQLRPAWFEARGDLEKDRNLIARAWYRRGYRADPTYSQNWIKALGCCREDDEAIEEIIVEFRSFQRTDSEGARRVMHFLKKPDRQDLKQQRRWRQGYQHLLDADVI